ncbi:MAG: hypothetical protein MUC63_01995 [Planctomycetes bacterium]|jgi:hypothetical protein|nr:hypothetical protein [Planctomycetota bacterium]
MAGTSANRKAFERKSVTLTVLLVCAAVTLVIGLTGVGLRFGLPEKWARGEEWTLKQLDQPLLGLFRKLGRQYVEASDLDKDGKEKWGARIDGIASTLREEKGPAEPRAKVRGFYDGIAAKMQDGALTKAELEPFEKDVDQALAEIEALEAKAKE